MSESKGALRPWLISRRIKSRTEGAFLMLPPSSWKDSESGSILRRPLLILAQERGAFGFPLWLLPLPVGGDRLGEAMPFGEETRRL